MMNDVYVCQVLQTLTFFLSSEHFLLFRYGGNQNEYDLGKWERLRCVHPQITTGVCCAKKLPIPCYVELVKYSVCDFSSLVTNATLSRCRCKKSDSLRFTEIYQHVFRWAFDFTETHCFFNVAKVFHQPLKSV